MSDFVRISSDLRSLQSELDDLPTITIPPFSRFIAGALALLLVSVSSFADPFQAQTLSKQDGWVELVLEFADQDGGRDYLMLIVYSSGHVATHVTDGGWVSISKLDTTNIFQSACGFFRHMSLADVPSGINGVTAPGPKNAFSVSLSVHGDNFSAYYESKFIPKITPLPKRLARVIALIRTSDPQIQAWVARNYGKHLPSLLK
jgi:hypothetical protein